MNSGLACSGPGRLGPPHGAHLAACRRRRNRTGRRRRTRGRSRPRRCGICSRSSTAPLCGSMRRMSLSSPSQVPCHSSPSTQVTPVTKRFDSMVRLTGAGLGVDLVDLAVAVLRPPTGCPRPRSGPSRCRAGRRDGRQHRRSGSILSMRSRRSGTGACRRRRCRRRRRRRACAWARRWLRVEGEQLGARSRPRRCGRRG
jgi:hypothetical protein